MQETVLPNKASKQANTQAKSSKTAKIRRTEPFKDIHILRYTNYTPKYNVSVRKLVH